MDVPQGEEWEFYDLDTDPAEMNNRYTHPESMEKISEMKKELARLKKEYRVPKKDSDVDEGKEKNGS